MSVHQTTLLKLDHRILLPVAMIIPCLELVQWNAMMMELYRLLQIVQVNYGLCPYQLITLVSISITREPPPDLPLPSQQETVTMSHDLMVVCFEQILLCRYIIRNVQKTNNRERKCQSIKRYY